MDSEEMTDDFEKVVTSMSAKHLALLFHMFKALDQYTQVDVLDALERPNRGQISTRAQGFLNVVDSFGVYIEQEP